MYLLAGSAVMFLLAILSWHQQTPLAESKNNQMLLAVSISAGLSFFTSAVLTQMNTHHLWMGHLLVGLLQLAILSVSVARFDQMSRDDHTESQLGSLRAQQVVNTVIVVVSLGMVFLSLITAYRLFAAQDRFEMVLTRAERISEPVYQHSKQPFSFLYSKPSLTPKQAQMLTQSVAEIDQLLQTNPVNPAMRDRAMLFRQKVYPEIVDQVEKGYVTIKPLSPTLNPDDFHVLGF